MSSKSVFTPPPECGHRQVPVLDGYRQWAEHYDDMLTDTVDGPILRRFIERLPDIQGARLLDIGCGTGRTVQWLREQAITVEAIGVDICAEMLVHARDKGIYQALHQGDHPPLEGRFDLACSVLVSCHIDDLERHYHYAAEHLDDEGKFILIDMHPHLFHVGKGTYVPVSESEQIYITNYLHELSDHVHAARHAGFTLVELEESFVPETWAASSPSYTSLCDHPLGIGFLWRKRS